MLNWEPMDGPNPPPRDGTVIFVYDQKPMSLFVDEPNPYGKDAHTAAWGTEGYDGWVAGPDAETDPFDIDPTHWLPGWKQGDPIPPPPALTGG